MNMFSQLIDWIYPRHCVLCDCLLGKKERYLCKSCGKVFPQPIQEPRCMKCGKSLQQEEKEYCYDCSKNEQEFTRGIGIFQYRDSLKDAVMRFKFKERREYGEFLGKLMCVYGKKFVMRIQPEVIIPVPIHKKKAAMRGYNQAEELAKIISKGFSIPIQTNLVLRKKFTKAQKELNRKERRKNLQEAFEVDPAMGKYKKVLIVDDIYTTGSTINAIAGKLKKVGVEEVYFLTLCIGKGY